MARNQQSVSRSLSAPYCPFTNIPTGFKEAEEETPFERPCAVPNPTAASNFSVSNPHKSTASDRSALDIETLEVIRN